MQSPPAPRRLPHLTRRSALAAAAATLLLALAACRTTLDMVPPPGSALCPVCRCEGDMACVVVEKGPDTPSLVRDGQTYWFCSEECRDRFAADPSPYE